MYQFTRRVAGWIVLTISLMSVVGKVFGRILNERVKLVTADKVMDEQGGFRVGRECNDQIFE